MREREREREREPTMIETSFICYIHTSNRRIPILKGQFVDIDFLLFAIVISDGALIWLWHLALIDWVHHANYSFFCFSYKDCERLAAMDRSNG